MSVVVIGAVSQNGVYANGSGGMPWYSKIDLENFRRQTLGYTVVMGRRTWDSLPEGRRPLDGRQNIVVSSSMEEQGSVRAVRSLSDALRSATGEKVFIIGGAGLWDEALASGIADAALITVVGVQIYSGEGPQFFTQFTDLSRHYPHMQARAHTTSYADVKIGPDTVRDAEHRFLSYTKHGERP
jgi:dihydrofolate reductase